MDDGNLKTSVKRLSFSFTLIVILACVLSLVGAQQISDRHQTIAIIVYGFSTSLLASLIFARFYAWLVEAHNLKIIGDELSTGIKSSIEEIKTAHHESLSRVTKHTLLKMEELERKYNYEISSHFRELIPLDYFPPSAEPDRRFNDLINTSLENTSSYIFKGVTGRHVPIRLQLMQPCHLQCKVLLIDPRRNQIMWLYARDRYSHEEFKNKEDIAERLNKIKRDVFMTIIALFDIRWRVGVEIILYSGPVFYRTEIFDDYAVVSFLIGKTPGQYPVTYLYRRGTIYYDAFLTDIYHTSELSADRVVFHVDSPEEMLKEFLQSLGFDPDGIAECRQEFEAFKHDFKNHLKSSDSSSASLATLSSHSQEII